MTPPHEPREADKAMDLMDQGYKEMEKAMETFRRALRAYRGEDHDDDDRGV